MWRPTGSRPGPEEHAVVNIGDSLRRWRDLARLRAQVRRSPTPAAWGDLAERLIAVGSIDDALEAAEKGLRSFPDSERLASVRLFARRTRFAGQIRRLREDALRRPTPAAWTQLAALYREIGSDDEALEAARECADRFPLHESAHLLQGEIRLERFVEDRIARDAVVAAESLRRAAQLNPREPSAHALLGELCWLVDDLRACRVHLRALLALTPGDRAVQDFLRELGADAEGADEAETSFEERAQRVEESGTLARSPDGFPGAGRRSARTGRAGAAELDVEALKRSVVELGSQPGVRASVVLGRDGEILADTSDGVGTTRREFADLVTALCATADDAGRRMDAGGLVRAELECPAGNVTAARVRGVTVGVRYDATLRPGEVWEIVQDFVARSLPGAAEGARA